MDKPKIFGDDTRDENLSIDESSSPSYPLEKMRGRAADAREKVEFESPPDTSVEEPDARCKLCCVPLQRHGRTGYCSERCMVYDFFGVPALRQRAFLRYRAKNLQRMTVEDPQITDAYPGLDGFPDGKIIRALALITEINQQIDGTR